MELPEIPTEQQITKRLQSFRRQIDRYRGTIWRSLRSPTSLVLSSMRNRPNVVSKTSTAPILFVPLTIVFASLIGTIADMIFGVDVPFYPDSSYFAIWRAYGDWITSLQAHLWYLISPAIFLQGLKFVVVSMVIVFWARLLSGSKRKYWDEVVALSYLLPIVLVAMILEYCAVNLLFRIIGTNSFLFMIANSLISIILTVFVYGVVLRVINKAYFVKGYRRSIHIVGYVLLIPIILLVLSTANSLAPAVIQFYRIISPTMKGEAKIDAREFEAAENYFLQAIKNDSRGTLSSRAHILLVSVYAHQILTRLPDITLDSGVRGRLFHYFVHTQPLQRVFKFWRPKGSIKVTPTQLIEFRDSILNSYLIAGDIPITNSEVDCALSSTAVEKDCDDLSKEDVASYVNRPEQRQKLFYFIYQKRALRGEPSTTDARRYLQFLMEIPTRIEIMYVRYRALNLARDSETLAYLDDQSRYGKFNRERIIKGNSDILKYGYKYPHLILPESELKKLSDPELEFQFRQVYVNYLRSEVKLLGELHINAESSIIKLNTASMEEQLNWVAKKYTFRDTLPENNNDQSLPKLYGTDSVSR